MSQRFDEHVANAVLGIDTLWGGDVMNPSGLGRFIADSWFSDAPLPPAYTHPAAARVRESGGVSAKEPDRAAVETYLAAVDVRGAIAALGTEAKSMSGLRGRYVAGLALCFEVMLDLGLEILGKGEPVPYERCVLASTGQPPSPSDPATKRRQVQELLARAGHPSASDADLLAAVDAWRGTRYVPDGLRALRGRRLHRPLSRAGRAQPAPVPAEPNSATCPWTTSSSCPSRTPGSRVR